MLIYISHYKTYIMTDEIKKNKCDTLLKKIFGSNFYFVHGTDFHKIESILKSGYINISPEIDKKYWSWYTYDEYYMPIEGLTHVYCWIKYDNMQLTFNDGYFCNFLIDPRILFDEDIIFNSHWGSNPIETDINDPDAITTYFSKITGEKITTYNFSVHLNKSDSKEERLEKLEKIKIYIPFISQENTAHHKSHEFLFPKKIDLKKYLIGITSIIPFPKSVKKILKRKYKNVKIYEISRETNYPTLMEIIC